MNPRASETALLGAVMAYGSDALHLAVSSGVTASAFHLDAHGRLWQLLEDMDEAHTPISMLSACGEIAKRDPDRFGGLAYVSALPDCAPALEAVPHWSGQVCQANQYRRLQQIGDRVAAAVEGHQPIDAIVADTIADLDRIGDGAEKAALDGRGMAELLWRGVTTDQDAPMSMGDRVLDELFGCALVPGRFSILAARPGQGKTAVALNLIWLLLCRRFGCAMLSLEQPAEQIAKRLCAIDGAAPFSGRGSLMDRPPGVDIRDWYGAKLEAITDHGSLVSSFGSRWRVDDRPKMSLPYIRSVLIRLQRQMAAAGEPLRLVVLDYIQICQMPRSDTRAQALALLAAGLAGLAKELRISLIVLAQLSRAVDTRGGEPRLSDLKDSGGLEESAEAVFGLWRPNQDRPGHADNLMKLKRMKNRNGPLSRADLQWEGRYLRITSIPRRGEWS